MEVFLVLISLSLWMCYEIVLVTQHETHPFANFEENMKKFKENNSLVSKEEVK